jgi:choline dehydrogenase-like flavoprotein
LPALERHGAKLLSECEVLRLEADASSVRAVHCNYQGREIKLRGRVVILSAGAFMSPILLLNSRSPQWPDGLANSSGMVGRNLMVHVSDYIAVSPRRGGSTNGPKKSLAFNDLYVDHGVKLGTFQSVGVTVTHGSIAYYLRGRIRRLPAWLQRWCDPFIRIIARIAVWPFRHAAVFASIIEDLPYAHNRVLPDPDAKNGMRFEYRYPDELRARSALFRTRLHEVLRPKHRLFVLSGENNLNYGHVCGTVRFGSDPRTSVLDKNNRAHDVSNLYVVDASFFPSSGGTNPSLTIAANALRVEQAVHQQLEQAAGSRAQERASAGA